MRKRFDSTFVLIKLLRIKISYRRKTRFWTSYRRSCPSLITTFMLSCKVMSKSNVWKERDLETYENDSTFLNRKLRVRLTDVSSNESEKLWGEWMSKYLDESGFDARWKVRSYKGKIRGIYSTVGEARHFATIRNFWFWHAQLVLLITHCGLLSWRDFPRSWWSRSMSWLS